MKLKIHRTLLWCSFTYLVSIACNRPQSRISWDGLIAKYEERHDTLGLHAIKFLQHNIEDHTFDSAVFISNSGKIIPRPASDEVAKEMLDKGQILLKNEIYKDEAVITTEFIEGIINNATQSFNRYPWANSVPEDIFMNYVLSYKIYNDRPEYYRPFFQSKFKEYCTTLIRKIATDSSEFKYDPNEFFYRIAVEDIGQWFKYSTDYIQFERTASFANLLKYCKGDCIRAAYFNVYALRSLGLPCTVDFVPAWGSKNGGHAQEVFYDPMSKKMRTPSGRDLRHAAKVIRYTFSKQNIWKDSILPNLNDPADFRIEYLKSNYWLDVTQEHCHTSDVKLSKKTLGADSKIYYICVNNFNEWIPAFWGTSSNDSIEFKSMGTDILYWVGTPHKNSILLKGKPFVLQQNGVLRFFNPIVSKNQVSIDLSKINTGELSWVKQAHNYKLSYLSDKNRWMVISVKKCQKDSIIKFSALPKNALLKLQDLDAEKDLSRIFIIENGVQKWY